MRIINLFVSVTHVANRLFVEAGKVWLPDFLIVLLGVDSSYGRRSVGLAMLHLVRDLTASLPLIIGDALKESKAVLLGLRLLVYWILLCAMLIPSLTTI